MADKPRIRRIRDPWWHWPLAVLWVLLQAVVGLSVLIGLATWIGPRLDQWVDPGVFLALLLGGALLAAVAWLFITVRDCVEYWRRR